MTNCLRTVLVGFGRIAAGNADDPLTARHYPYATHAQVLAAHPAFAWDAVVDPSPAALARARSRWRIRRTAERLEQLGGEYEPEVAVIATPPEHREEILEHLPTVRAVVVEKPLGLTLSQAESFLARCRRREILVQVNLWRRADERFRALAAGELARLIGEPQAVFGVYGNGLLNNGTHLVDFVRMLLGEVEAARAVGEACSDEALPIRGDLDVAFDLRLVTGQVAAIRPLRFEHYRENGLDIWGERARLAIMAQGLSLLLYRRGRHRALAGAHEIACERPQALGTTVGGALYRLYDNLAAAIHDDAPLWSPGEEALQTARVIDAIMVSARNGRAEIDIARVSAPCGCGR